MPWNVAQTTQLPQQKLDYEWMTPLIAATGAKNDQAVAAKALSEATDYAKSQKRKMYESRFKAGKLLRTGGYDLSTGDRMEIDPEVLSQKLEAGAYVDSDGNLHDSEDAYGVYAKDRVQRELQREQQRALDGVAVAGDTRRTNDRAELERYLDSMGVAPDKKAEALHNWDSNNANYDELDAWSAKTPSKSKKFGNLGKIMKSLREESAKAEAKGKNSLSEKMSVGSYDKTKGITGAWLENIIKGNIERDIPQPDLENQARLEYLQRTAGDRLQELFAGGKDIAGGEIESLQKLIDAQDKRASEGQTRRDLSLNTLAGQSMAIEGRRESASADRNLKAKIAADRLAMGMARIDSNEWIAQLNNNTRMTVAQRNAVSNISTALATSSKMGFTRTPEEALAFIDNAVSRDPALRNQVGVNLKHSARKAFGAISPTTGQRTDTQTDVVEETWGGFGPDKKKTVTNTTIDPGGIYDPTSNEVLTPAQVIERAAGSVSGQRKSSQAKSKKAKSPAKGDAKLTDKDVADILANMKKRK